MPTRDRRPFWPCLVLMIVALVFLGLPMPRTPHFVDESAYLSQTYFLDLLLDGPRDSPAWLEYPAIDLPPLPKYLFGLALKAIQQPRPGPEQARAWYRDTATRVVPDGVLHAARWPSVLLGVVGVGAVFLMGRRLAGVGVGVLAGVSLMANPLYALHARRCMADVPAEAFVLLTAAAGLPAWARCLSGQLGPATWALFLLAGSCGGLAVEAKLNGGLGLIILGSWTALGLVLPGVPTRRRLALVGGFLAASALAFGTFVALNPTLTVQPKGSPPPDVASFANRSVVGRALELVRFRAQVSNDARSQFPHNALDSPGERLKAVLAQGYGRFGPLGPTTSDSTIRFDWRQDWGAIVWLPLVAWGTTLALVQGWKERRTDSPPMGWALAMMGLTTFAVVVWFIPLAWDRYFLPIQASGALLAAYGVVSTVSSFRAKRAPSAS